MSELIFNQTPVINIASNTFINVPIILRYEDINLIEVVRKQTFGYYTKIPIYHSDGTYLGVARNSRFFPNSKGEKANVIIDKYFGLWICKMNGKELFEIRQQTGNLFKTTAELYTNDGSFVKVEKDASLYLKNGINIMGAHFRGNTFSGVSVGIHATKRGISVGGMMPPPNEQL